MDSNEDFVEIDSAIVVWGNYLQVVGAYIGNDSYGEGKTTVLHFPFRPPMIMTMDGSYQATPLFLRSGTKDAANGTAGVDSVLSPTWGKGGLFWYMTG